MIDCLLGAMARRHLLLLLLLVHGQGRPRETRRPGDMPLVDGEVPRIR